MFLLTTVSGLDISPNDRGEPVFSLGYLNFTDDRSYLESLISVDFAGAMGSLEYTDMLMGNVITIFSSIKTQSPLDEPLAALSVWQHDLLLLFYCLWLIRDNSLDLGVGFAVSGPPDDPVFSCNTKAVSHSLADGTSGRQSYSTDEFELAANYSELEKNIVEGAYSAGYPDTLKSSADRELGGTVFASPGVTQMTRATYAISCARSTGDIGLKIANYVMFLEILFTTSAAELSHKLAERVALFLGQTAKERLEIFEKVKKLYSIRSRMVHGDIASKRQIKAIAEDARTADQLARAVITKTIRDPELIALFDGPARERERYFTNLVLGR